MRVGIVALLQESNTFLGRHTTLEQFRDDLLLSGDDVSAALADTQHEVGGFIAGLRLANIEPVGILAARALPYGVIARSAHDALVRLLDDALSAAGRLDGVLVAAHGATVSEPESDFDGFWLSRLRERVGRQTPVIGTLDPHANLSPTMVAACDALLAYRTNPHLDQRERGLQAAQLMARSLRGEMRPVQAGSYPPLAMNIERQSTAEEPCRGLLAAARALEEREGMLASSVLLGFPYADVAEMGAAALVVADGDARLAQRGADELGRLMWQRRADCIGRLVDVPTAVEQAASLEGPVCLLDMGDNVGGGSAGDGTLLARALVERGLGPAFVCLCDPESVAATRAAGVGSTLAMRVGGKTDERHGAPLAGAARVIGISDGRWTEAEPRHGGFAQFDQGPTALVQFDGLLTVMLTSRRMAPFSLGQLTSQGVDLAAFRFLIAKGVHAPVAAYAPVCRHLLRVNTPGATTADLSTLPYRRRRRPMFPFEPDAQWRAP